MAKNALLPLDKFKATELVGEASSFFGAQVATNKSKKPKKKAPGDDEK